jgi:hypothetical protein
VFESTPKSSTRRADRRNEQPKPSLSGAPSPHAKIDRADRASHLGAPSGRTVIVDSNVWRMLSDRQLVDRIRHECRARGFKIVVPPAVINEALRTSDLSLRTQLIEQLTRETWLHPMPEIYTESREVLHQVRKLRPNWLASRPDLKQFFKLESDWKGGWRRRVRTQTDRERQVLKSMGSDARLDKSRNEMRDRRAQQQADGFRLDVVNPTEYRLQREIPAQGEGQVSYSTWRVEGMVTWWAGLFSERGGSAYQDWASPFLDLRLIEADRASWEQFWLDDLPEYCIPTIWVRATFGDHQALRGNSSGTPADNQIVSYLINADLFLSADKAFIASIDDLRQHCPWQLARPRRIRKDELMADVLGALSPEGDVLRTSS